MLRRPYVLIPSLLAVLLALPAARAAAQTPASPSLKLSFDADGGVTLAAQSVTVRDVMAEWARQCGCFVVNADKLTGPPFATPILFEHQPQDVVLASLLRQAAGYSLTPPRPGSKSVSKYEVIYILATSSASGSPSTYAATSPVAVPLSTPGAVDDEIPPVTPQAPATLAQQAPRPGTSPAPAPGQTPGYTAPASSGTGTSGVFVPLIPVGSSQSPQQPANQPGRPTTTPGR
jgi:hypothetical protein